MGDFTEIVNAIPEFKNPARRESYVNTSGIEIVVLTPLDGSPVIYASAVQVQTNQGPMSINFPIVGVTCVQEACVAWQEAARAALIDFGEKMRENQRRIVLPGNPAANTIPFKTIN